jgi:hypothetical protein
VTEQFRFEQSVGQASTVNRDKGFSARAEIMNTARDKLFARTRLAENEHGRICACSVRDSFVIATIVGCVPLNPNAKIFERD